MTDAVTMARDVFVFTNGMVAVLDADGRQIPELQGIHNQELRDRIIQRSDARTVWLNSLDACHVTRALAATVEQPSAGNADPRSPVQKRVNDVIEDLSAGRVKARERRELGEALDAADRPLAGRAGADEGVGRAIGQPARWR